MNFSKINSSSIDDFKRRVVKLLRKGKSDVQTCIEVAPYGVDSSPIKDMVAIYAPTGINGQAVVVGYLNKNQKAETGEFRTFATDENGSEIFYTWMKKNGTIEIGGDADYAVKYSKLEQAFNQLKTDINNLVIAFNAHQHVAPTGGGATTGAQAAQISSADISQAKNSKIKTI